ncbi:AAA family ATPase [Haloarcula argentinensis]|uniref:ParA family protein n=1 Tax=Haloarcula argentinensis TaxID=43776 RepID=A0ABU2F310_HALAR|nr:ParA family protein [Haloarcula argentinensis]EMA20858.1 cell division inhibitor [Haloarcula argentinensis DSM 12282]MDS0254942.1 ParA family protein [Haloarcula argentinensis]
MGVSTLAFVGCTGGAGTTRLTVETAATLARSGRSVAVVDAAFGTQGLATYVDGRLDADVTAVAVGDASVDDALFEWGIDADGRVAICPSHAPFERLARAKSAESAQTLEQAIEELAGRFDHVLLDVPPIASNQAVAAATTAQRRALVVPASQRGSDLLPRQQGRLRDIGAPASAVIATRVHRDTDESVEDAAHTVPHIEPGAPRPLATDPDTDVAPTVAAMTEDLLDVDLGLTFEDDGLFSR